MRGLLVVVLTLAPLVAAAKIAGIAGAAGHRFTCEQCHSGRDVPTVRLDGPARLTPGEIGAYQVVLTGGAGVVGGFDLAVVDGGATLIAGRGSKVLGGELVHDGPQPFDGGSVSFELEIAAPSVESVLPVYVGANSANGDGRPLGDRAAYLETTIVVAWPDAGVADAGGLVVIDAGSPDDAGSEPIDAGLLADAGVLADAGLLADAGDDAGAAITPRSDGEGPVTTPADDELLPPDEAVGCAAASGGSGAAGVLVIALAAVLIGARRRF